MVIPSGTHRTVNAPAPRLALDGISRQYGSVIALAAASLSVERGEVHALLGENGAGKSTLMKIVYGLEQPDGGTMRVDGVITQVRSPRDAMRQGIGMVQQHFALVDALTVAENVALGGSGSLDLRATRARIREISADAGLPIDPDARVSSLAVGAQQRVEIVKALSRDTTMLILDEPTAVLAPQEATELLAWTRRFAAGGGTVILIAHKLREVLSVADRITVLRKGRTVYTSRATDATESMLADAMLGAAGVVLPDPVAGATTARATTARTPAGTAAKTAAATAARTTGSSTARVGDVLVLSNVSITDGQGVQRVRDASVTVRSGEILGVAAVEGAGQHELLRVMAGRTAPTHGSVTLPSDVGFAPEDRHRDAIVLDATLTENVALKGAGRRQGIMHWNAFRDATRTLMHTRDVRASDEAAVMQTLSGGNQQKLVLGRELADAPAVLVVENPTRGLDIRATADVHAALRSARDQGTAVIVYSSDLDEVLALADRVIVVAAGRVREVPADRESVGRAMLVVTG